MRNAKVTNVDELEGLAKNREIRGQRMDMVERRLVDQNRIKHEFGEQEEGFQDGASRNEQGEQPGEGRREQDHGELTKRDESGRHERNGLGGDDATKERRTSDGRNEQGKHDHARTARVDRPRLRARTDFRRLSDLTCTTSTPQVFSQILGRFTEPSQGVSMRACRCDHDDDCFEFEEVNPPDHRTEYTTSSGEVR